MKVGALSHFIMETEKLSHQGVKSETNAVQKIHAKGMKGPTRSSPETNGFQ